MSDEGIRDWELLDEYTHKASQEAFARIVQRYVNMVYSTCFRDLRDHQLAEDATQAVFMVLARKARSLRREIVLAGWLFQTARLVVRNARKQEARRKARERQAAEMTQQTWPSEQTWDGLSPLLSEGMEKLGNKDRDAILLHYFQRKTLAEVGGSMGVSEDAARMRVSRAVQKLRSFFGRKGQTMAIGAVATLLLTNSVQAAPPACAATVVAAVCGSVGKAALATSSAAVLANATMKTLLVAKLKMAFTVAAVSLLVPTAGLATYHAIAARLDDNRRALVANTIVREEIRQPAIPAGPSPASKPALPQASKTVPGAAGQPKLQPAPQPTRQPATAKLDVPPATAKPYVPPADLLRFKIENGLLTVSGPATPADGKPVRIALRGLPGETTLSHTPTSLGVENSRIADGSEIRTRIVYQLGTSLQIQRTIKPRNGKEYAFMLRQSHRNDPVLKVLPGQTTLQVTADGGENWNSWTADDFPRFVENYPLAFFAHLAPLLRDFSAPKLYAPPAAVARKALSDGKIVASRPALSDLLSNADATSAALIWRREIEMLNRDVAFLIDCLESDELDVRVAALKRLNEVTGKIVAFDASDPPEKRKAALGALRRGLGAVMNGL